MSDDDLNKLLKDEKYEGKSWVPIIQAEILAESKKNEQQRVIPVKIEKETKTLDKKDFPVRGMRKLLEIKGPGKLREITFRSPSSSFIVKVVVDGKSVIERTYNDLVAISDYNTFVDAFEDDTDGFIVNLKNYSFSESFQLYLVVVGPAITFNNIFAMWDINV
jgi:hypothetical protein